MDCAFPEVEVELSIIPIRPDGDESLKGMQDDLCALPGYI